MLPSALAALCCALLIGGALSQADGDDIAGKGERGRGRAVLAAGV